MEPGYNPKELLKTEGNQRYQLIVGIMRNTFKQAYPGLLINADPMTSTYLNLNLKDFVPQGATAPSPLGFMWSDFTITRDEPGIAYNNGRSFIFGQNATSVVLEAASDEDVKLWSVFRAHQHSSLSNPIMRRLVASKGLFRHWQTVDSLQLHSLAINSLKARIEVQDERAIPQGSVWTFNVAPDSVYGTGLNYRFDAFGILTLTEDPKDWRVRIVNQAIKID